MGISKENARKLKWLWQDDNKITWIESFIKIVDKNTNIIPFKLTQEQKDLVEGLEKFNIISKSRQLGISTVTIALSLRESIVNPNSNCLLVSYDQKSCNAVFNKLKQQYNLLPKWLKPKELANNRQELKFTNGSRITCVTAGNKDLGRGDTLHVVHMSEMAFYKDAEKHLNSILQALAPTGVLIIESTSNGLNCYADLVRKADNKENDFKLFFYNWINGKSLFLEDYKQACKSYKNRHNGKMLTLEEIDDEEKELIKLGASIEQLVWRRSKIEKIGIDRFRQEFPSTLNESFITTGNSVFDNSTIDNVEKGIIHNKTKYIDIKNIVDLPKLLQGYYGKSFFMYSIPKSGEKYYIGCDLSEGVGGDYSVIEVLNKDGEQVAEFYNNKIKPYQMAEIINCIGHYYNKGLITVEKASGGHSVIERLRYEFKYMNMTKYKSYDQFNRMVWNVGFDTNTKTKSMIINDFVELFEKGQLKINSRRLLQEMKVFEINENGSMGAISGSHDDTVMAMALAIVSLRNPFYYSF